MGGQMQDIFRQPNSMECVNAVNEIANKNWETYMGGDHQHGLSPVALSARVQQRRDPAATGTSRRRLSRYQGQRHGQEVADFAGAHAHLVEQANDCRVNLILELVCLSLVERRYDKTSVFVGSHWLSVW